MSRIVITAPPYTDASGGIIALHKLCHMLISSHVDAYLFPLNGGNIITNPQYKSAVTYSIDESDIVIYPEIVWGNPLNVKCVVRYIMNDGHITLNRKDTWEDSDFWLYYSELFYDGLREKNILTILESFVDFYEDKKLERTIKSCHTFRKNPNPKQILHDPATSIQIHPGHSRLDLLDIFNKCERFYSYDKKTYLNTIAALCGCNSIIVSDDYSDYDKIITNTPSTKYGVAYGLHNLDHIEKTKHKLRPSLRELESNQYKDLKRILSKITEHFKIHDF